MGLVVRGMRDADAEDFSAFVRERGDELLRFARRLIPDAGEAEDALQTALLRMTSHWPKDHPEAYVRAALMNLAKDRARRRHLVAVPTQDLLDGAEIDVDHADALEAQARLDALLATLQSKQRITVVLRVLDGLSEAETAVSMGCSPGTVRSNLARGLDKARMALSACTSSVKET